jgi:hypothetical protein
MSFPARSMSARTVRLITAGSMMKGIVVKVLARVVQVSKHNAVR